MAALILALQARAPLVRQISARGRVIDFTFDGERAAFTRLHRELVTQYEGIVSLYERRLTVEDVFLAVGSHQTT